MTEELDSEEIHGGRQLWILVLAGVEFGGCRETINEDERRF